MSNRLLIFGNCFEHYFYRQGSGIFVRKRSADGVWSEPFCDIAEACGPFCVYPDSLGQAHILYIDSKNRLIYCIRKDGLQKKHILSCLKSDIRPEKMEVVPICGRLNLLYSARYNEKYILVHCILGNHAKPQLIDYLDSAHFWICNKKVYYSNASGSVGCVSLHDEKPDTFNKLYDFGECVTAYSSGPDECVLYKNASRLYFNKKELLYDSSMEMPTLIDSHSRLYIVWKSGGYIRYIFSCNNGASWSGPMRFMTNGAPIETYLVQKSGNMHLYYGYNSASDLHLFPNPDILQR